jgi:hypothetical protein
MNKRELKHILKPLIKECIKEVIFEDGVLSNIISEVVIGTELIKENNKSSSGIIPRSKNLSRKKTTQPKKQKIEMQSNRNKILESLGKTAYGGVDIFEGTAPLSRGGVPSNPSVVSTSSEGAPMFDDLDPSDPGVDISKFF